MQAIVGGAALSPMMGWIATISTELGLCRSAYCLHLYCSLFVPGLEIVWFNVAELNLEQ